MEISIIIPAHNEEKRIGRTLESYGKFFKDLKKRKKIRDFEIVVVLNACNDDTIGVVKKAGKKYREIKYLQFKMGGKGFAIIQGFKYSISRKKKLIGFVDADMATPPEAFYELIKNMGDYDVVIASRWHKKSVVEGRTLFRAITSKGFNFLVRAFFLMPYRDTQCGAKLFKKEALERVINEIGLTNWAFDVDLIYKIRKKRFRIKENPTVWKDEGGSKLNVTKVPMLMFFSIIRLRILNSPFKDIIRLYDKLPESIKLHHR